MKLANPGCEQSMKSVLGLNGFELELKKFEPVLMPN
jgi:hypothetical protein